MRKTIISKLLILFSAVGLFAQGGIIEKGETFLKPLQKRDSVLIADQVYYGFELKGVEQGTILNIPIIQDTLMTGIRVVSPFKLEQTASRSQGPGYPDLIDYKGGLVITSFDEGIYHLPPLTLQSMTSLGVLDTLVFSPQILEVKTVQVDTTTYKLTELKGLIEYPITFGEVAPWIYTGLGATLLIALLVLLILSYRRKKKTKLAPKIPAHILALQDLEKYRDPSMRTQEKQKAYYSGITDVLRVYISDRYGFGAMEMTTAQIFGAFKQRKVNNEHLKELKDLFELADSVKFAKFVVSEQDAAEALPVAVRFVTSTYQEELEEAAEVKDAASSQTKDNKEDK